MENRPIETLSRQMIVKAFASLEKHLNCDLLTMYGDILDGMENFIDDIIKDLKSDPKNTHTKLFIILTTAGGSLTPVQKMVQVFRHYYEEVCFIVPDYAYSAGTILCMSGDEIYMNYFSNLGPIDPQVVTKDGKKYVSALGYLDKIHELLAKAQNKTLTEAEFIILKDFDLAELRYYETLTELAIDLLTKWLTHYKFKNWNKHKDGTPVTIEQKTERANQIARDLNDNNKWKSHGRPISMEELAELKIQINNIDDDSEFSNRLSAYYKMMLEYVRNNKYKNFFQTRKLL